MNTVVALGDSEALEGFALAGVRVVPACSPEEILDEWNRLGPDVGLVVISRTAARVLEHVMAERPEVLTAVVP